MKKPMKKFRLKGQSTLEYAFLVAIIAAGIIAMQFYMKRAVEGKAKQAADQISENPYDSEGMELSSIQTNVNSEAISNYQVITNGDEYAVDETDSQQVEQTRTGSEHLNPW
ncbi:MAG: hypothetical protein NTY14_02315 [Candidatus Omnitrophica bacterium]|nr:hypothetical protein [Candidatus Omnitrophota bacterium]